MWPTGGSRDSKVRQQGWRPRRANGAGLVRGHSHVVSALGACPDTTPLTIFALPAQTRPLTLAVSFFTSAALFSARASDSSFCSRSRRTCSCRLLFSSACRGRAGGVPADRQRTCWLRRKRACTRQLHTTLCGASMHCTEETGGRRAASGTSGRPRFLSPAARPSGGRGPECASAIPAPPEPPSPPLTPQHPCRWHPGTAPLPSCRGADKSRCILLQEVVAYGATQLVCTGGDANRCQGSRNAAGRLFEEEPAGWSTRRRPF